MTASELQVKLNRIIEEHGPNSLVFIPDDENKRLREATALEFNSIDVPEWNITHPVIYIK